MIWSQVTGSSMLMPAFSTKDFRYHNTWTLDQNGKTTSSSSQVAEATAPSKDCSSRLDWTSSGISARNPALANSAVYGGSRLIRSMPGSFAASRRASWIRC